MDLAKTESLDLPQAEPAKGGSIGAGWHDHEDDLGMGSSKATLPDGYVPPQSIGWAAGCEHGGEPVPCTVLDPFSGSGTTIAVAMKMGRSGIGIELNPEYAGMAEKRMRDLSPTLGRRGEGVH